MTRFRAGVAAALVVAALVAAWLLVGQPSRSDQPAAAGPAAADATPTPVPTAGRPPGSGTAGTAGPPVGTVAIGAAYLDRYRARRVDWDDVLDHGRPLPRPDASCASRWRRADRDSRISWARARYWCLDDLAGAHWKPQGVAGTATTEGYRISGRPAGGRNLVLTSWYSRADERGLFAANRRGQSVTRLVVLDLDRGRYGVVELVRPAGPDRLRNLNSHGSGLAWAGQYLYSSSHSWLWMYNADDLLEVGGHFVLPAVRRWSVSGTGGLSSISLDRSSGRDELVGINYSRRGPTLVHTFPLDRRGLLAPARPTATSLRLTPASAGRGRAAASAAVRVVPGTHYQGVARWRGYLLADSSSLPLRPGGPRTDVLTVVRRGVASPPLQLPGGNVESIYVDGRRHTYTSLTEAGTRFLFVLPLRDLLARATGKRWSR